MYLFSQLFMMVKISRNLSYNPQLPVSLGYEYEMTQRPTFLSHYLKWERQEITIYDEKRDLENQNQL